MSTATITKPAELELMNKPRKGRKPQEKSDAVTPVSSWELRMRLASR